MNNDTEDELSDTALAGAFLLDLLHLAGIASVLLEFSGGGDDGDINDVAVIPVEGGQASRPFSDLFTEELTKFRLLYPDRPAKVFPVSCNGESAEDLARWFFCEFICDAIGDWVNNEGGSGSTTFDIEERMIDCSVSFNTEEDLTVKVGSVTVDPGSKLEALVPLVCLAPGQSFEVCFDNRGGDWEGCSTDAALRPDFRPSEEQLENACAQIRGLQWTAGDDREHLRNVLIEFYEANFGAKADDLLHEHDIDDFDAILELAVAEGRLSVSCSLRHTVTGSGDGDGWTETDLPRVILPDKDQQAA